MTVRTIARRWAACLAALMLFAAPFANAAEPINTLEKKGFFSWKPNGIAIRGYDTVAYWTEGKPVKGSADFVTEYMGATWRFASQENLDLFLGDADYYAPQYGGYCAYGIAAQDALVKIEPENWSIYDDKLYLNYNDGIQSSWEGDIPGFIATADAKFEQLLKTE